MAFARAAPHLVATVRVPTPLAVQRLVVLEFNLSFFHVVAVALALA
ncbi:MAG: hypothetical protein M1368_04200 [Thaumarchaeota archaeon]|nr:hypothetical protein [Nitrososphaerota archaeon]MDG6996315.1 hypothetical protein [Nitrososphaerota archaeon]